MTLRLLFSLLTVFAATRFAFAEEANTESVAVPVEGGSYRSKATDLFWISGNGGFDPLGNNLAPVEFRTDVSFRVQFNRWIGLNVNYHDGWIDTLPRHGSATAHNTVFAIGPAIRVWDIGPHNRFWHGSYLLARAQIQRAKTKYHFSAYDNSLGHSVDLSNGSQTTTGLEAGADLFVPIYFGFWVNLGVGIESNNFDYPKIHEPGGDTMDLPSTLPFIRLGLAYSF